MNNKFSAFAVVALLSVLLSACGGSAEDGKQAVGTAKSIVAAQERQAGNEHGHGRHINIRRLVSFGDSLSDVGSYAVGTIAAVGGGQFTINGPAAKNWTAVLAEDFGLVAPCAAQTGLDGDPALGLSVMPPQDHPGCTAYAQGGARVSNPVGIGNKLTGGENVALGFLTVPVVQQIQQHLDLHQGKFDEDDMVLVMAGANDVFFQLGLLGAGAIDPTAAMVAVSQAADELAAAVNTQITANGAKRVVVLNVPNIAVTPFGNRLDAQSRALVDAMVNIFNSQLRLGVQHNKRVLYVDAYAYSYSEYTNPGAFGLSNVTDTACDLSPDRNFLGSSLICTEHTLIGTVTDHYLFADRVHPTPYGYRLIARLVSDEMLAYGWNWRKNRMRLLAGR